jgi:hypothetical protein
MLSRLHPVHLHLQQMVSPVFPPQWLQQFLFLLITSGSRRICRCFSFHRYDASPARISLFDLFSEYANRLWSFDRQLCCSLSPDLFQADYDLIFASCDQNPFAYFAC